MPLFFVRHDRRVNSLFKIRRGKNIYTIDNISYDDGIAPNGFDLITFHREVVDHA